MEQRVWKILVDVCQLLQKYKVQYILVGGTAVALNGYFRHSTNIAGDQTEKPDIDIWYNPTYENYFNILKVIEELGQDVVEFRKEKAPNPRRSFFKLEFDDFTFDALPAIKADVKFMEANQRKETIELEGTDILFLNLIDLLNDKAATARKKDIEDIEQLKKINREQ